MQVVHPWLWHYFHCRGRGSLPEAHLGWEDLHLVQRLDTSMHCHNTGISVLDDQLYKDVLREVSKWQKWKLPVTTQGLVFHIFVSANGTALMQRSQRTSRRLHQALISQQLIMFAMFPPCLQIPWRQPLPTKSRLLGECVVQGSKSPRARLEIHNVLCVANLQQGGK
jgi:hypothetical protein